MKKFFFALLIVIPCVQLKAQDSLLKSISDSISAGGGTEFVTGTFKTLYVVNMKTIEAPAAGALNFEIQHRFGTLNSGAYHYFGLDFATIRLGFDYGISDRLSVGIGISTWLKTFDGYLKYKLLRQTSNSERMPVSVSLLGTSSYFIDTVALKKNVSDKYRFNYTAQLLIARKFNSWLSIELTPTFIHYNLVESTADQNNVFALCGGARMKITKRMSINVEYDYLFPNQLGPNPDPTGPPRSNSLSLGWDIETGGHVFQLVFTNSPSMVESQYIGQTFGTWGKGYIYFGFNISRNFNLKPHNKPKS
jgi:hypothetical protein